MCELLGLSLRSEDTPRISFRTFRGRAGREGAASRNSDGWGVAWYPDGKAAAIIKEEIPANVSALAAFVGRYDRFRSRTFIAHVRRASRGEVTYRNSHPFGREWNGREYTFAHNGTLHGGEKLALGPFQPIGDTDSERLFCHLLAIIQTIGEFAAGTCAHLWDALLTVNQLSSKGRRSKINLLMTDGDTLIAYRDMFSKGGLYRLERPEHYSAEAAALEDGDYRIEFHTEKGHRQHAAIIATERLTNEAGWVKLEAGELCAFRGGRLIFSSADSLDLRDVEVYDASTWLGQRPEAPYVAGIPAALRRDLGVALGDAIVVSNGQAKERLKVHRTDKRLLYSGSCRATSPDKHICLPSRIRRKLGLTTIDRRHGTPGFTAAYTPVCIRPADPS
jgi:predicted glutamine amidotransferase